MTQAELSLECCVAIALCPKCYRQEQVLRASFTVKLTALRTHSAHSRRAATSTDPSDRCVRSPGVTARPAGEGGAFDGRPMEECLRSACPCLEALWRRIFGEKWDPPGGVVESTEPVPPPPPPQDRGSLYTALWGFESRLPEELSFRQRDLFAVLIRDGDWWSVQRIDPGGRVLDTGIVPGNYLARADSLESQT